VQATLLVPYIIVGVMGGGTTLAALSGGLVPLAGALALNRLLGALLFGVGPTDPATLAAVASTMAIVAAVACGVPAWRASRVDPNLVLRGG
jgi:putative ABC transport system permease protein